jgi:short-subunit dehydrogenase
MNLTGKNIILTGASSGIGFELARLIAGQKCNIALLSRRKEITDKAASDLACTGSKILSLKCDVTKTDEIKSCFNHILNEFGTVDIAILGSGVSFRHTVEEFNSETAKKTFDVNVFGITNFLEVLIPYFIVKKEGMIVGVSSLADGRGFPKSGLYCASKAAVTLLLESTRVELKKYNIKVLMVKPGFVKTPMTDKNDFQMPFLMPASKAAKIILNGIEKEKRVIQFPLPTALGARFLRLLPDGLFDFIAEKTQ